MRFWSSIASFCLGLLCVASGCAQPGSQQQFADLGELKLESGASIHGCKLGYRTLGTLNAAKSNAILFPTWFTGTTKDLLGVVSDKGYIDPGPYFWIFVDAIGDGVSCSPSNSATQHGVNFPEFTIRDMVESEHRLAVEKFGLMHVHAVVGVSMGGMQTFQWMVSYPDFMDVAVPVVGSPQLTSYDKLLWSTEEVAMVTDPEYAGGRYATNPKLKTVALLHNLNLTTPQARVEQTQTAGFEKFFTDVEKDGIGQTDANNWRWQIHAMLAQNVGKGSSLESVAAKVKARVLVVNSRQDHMVNPIPAINFAPMIHAKLLVLEGACGHLAPGCEAAKVRPAVAETLR
jgi:homoserine O-acetyltransferase/O-succinyltransferase